MRVADLLFISQSLFPRQWQVVLAKPRNGDSGPSWYSRMPTNIDDEAVNLSPLLLAVKLYCVVIQSSPRVHIGMLRGLG